MKVSKSGFAFMCIGAFWAWASSLNVSASETSPAQTSAQISSAHAVSTSEYVKAHSLGGNYTFDPRDGWQMVNVTNLQYKYRRNSSDKLSNTKRDLGGAVADVFQKLFKGLKGTGKPEQGTITWYTGDDLQNPSCWANGKWAPTDESFACALTLRGWEDRPKCFKFLELCHTPKKCVFVRVVDTCAGCAPGSKHIDLTKAAFKQLADFDVGQLRVQFRPATEPQTWSEKLWGPKVPSNSD